MDDRQLELSVRRGDPLNTEVPEHEGYGTVMSSARSSPNPSASQARFSSSSLHFPTHSDSGGREEDDDKSLDEHEINRKLNEIESSFLPESVHSESAGRSAGADDTYINLGSSKGPTNKEHLKPRVKESTDDDQDYLDAFDTRAGAQENGRAGHIDDEDESTIDSPSAAAAQRNMLRSKAPSRLRKEVSRSRESRLGSGASSAAAASGATSRARSAASTRQQRQDAADFKLGDIPVIRTSQHGGASKSSSPNRRLGHDARASTASSSHGERKTPAETESATDQDDGEATPVAPLESPMHAKNMRDLSRLPSFGSIASDVSHDEDRGKPLFNRGLSAISTGTRARINSIDEEGSSQLEPNTPRPYPSAVPGGVTDTVIAQHVQNIRVPDTIAQDFRSRFNGSISPDKRTMSTTSSARPAQSNLTLKEQNSKMDRLTKENFDLKLKIHFLDQALQNRSDEGIKDMINANVQFQTDLAKERRDNQTLKRKIRELEKELGDAQDELADVREAQAEIQLAQQQEMEIEITELRQQLEVAEVRITKLSAENLAKEMDRRRMSDYVNGLQQDRNGDVRDEEVQMWKDLLTEEQGRRDMIEDESKRLREELSRMRAERMRKDREEERRSRSRPGLRGDARNGTNSRSSVTLVEQLRHENVELRRDLGAQTSMLSSRNKERERLQQEIEDLKIMTMKGGKRRSMTGESIFDRSASRAFANRSPSRYSGLTGNSRASDVDRDEYERREGLLRDENAQIRLDYQDLEKEAAARMDYIESLEDEVKKAEVEFSAAVEDLRALQKERDDALVLVEARDADLEALTNDFKTLEDEAVTNIEALEDSIAQLERNRASVASQLRIKNEEFAALQAELRGLAIKIMQFEADRDGNVKRIESTERELDETTRELESVERKLRESEQKGQRLTVQAESWQSEITFLREEQEADKLKIGEITNSLQKAQQAVQDERERVQDLESTLADERRQRELVDNQSSQEVQNIISDLNAQNMKSNDELRKLRRSMASREDEAVQHKSRLDDFEANLRHALGEYAGGRPTILQDVEIMQQKLSRTIQDLESARQDVADKDRLLKSRDSLLENSGLETRRLTDLLEKERQGRKHDLHNFEVARRGSSSHLRAIANHENRNMELEAALTQAKRRATTMETRLREQIGERNTLLMSLWNRLSGLCGPQWTDEHGKLDGSTTDVDGIETHLTQFQRNIVAAIRHIESIFSELKIRIRNAEKQMSQNVGQLHTDLDARTKRLDQLEATVTEITEVNAQLRSHIANNHSSTTGRSPSVLGMASGTKLSKPHQEEVARLKSELKLAKTELKIHRAHPSNESRSMISADPDLNPRPGKNPNRRSMLGFMSLGGSNSSADDRHNSMDSTSSSTPSVKGRMSPATFASKFLRHSSGDSNGGGPRTLSLAAHHGNIGPVAQVTDGRGSVDISSNLAVRPTSHDFSDTSDTDSHLRQSQAQQHRLREVERRLLAEREARLLDRQGARDRLVGKTRENEELRAELARERERRGIVSERNETGGPSSAGALLGGHIDQQPTTTAPRTSHDQFQGSVAGVGHFTSSSASSSPAPEDNGGRDSGNDAEDDEASVPDTPRANKRFATATTDRPGSGSSPRASVALRRAVAGSESVAAHRVAS